MILRAGHGVALLTLALLVFGVVMVSSAGLEIGTGVPRVTSRSLLLGAHVQHAILAMAALCAGMFVPLARLERIPGLLNPMPWLLLCSIGLLLLAMTSFGVTMNHSNRWLEIAGVRFHASECAKWCLPAFLAWYLTRPANDPSRFFRGLLPALLIIGTVTFIVVIEDLGTAFLMGCVALAVVLAAGARIRYFIAMVPALLGALAAAIIVEPYRIRRIEAFLNPWADPSDGGWHVIESMRAIAGGAVLGRGLGAGEQKFDLISDTTDFIFSTICEELGLVGAALVIAAFVALLFCGLSIITGSRRPSMDASSARRETFYRLLGLGVILTIGMQALFNILVATAMVPPKGIALPLISRGGTGWILTAFCLGLVIAIERSRRHDQGAEMATPQDAPPESNRAGGEISE